MSNDQPLGAQLTGFALIISAIALAVTGDIQNAIYTLGMLVVLTLGYYYIHA